MNTAENNKLIAEFMGATIVEADIYLNGDEYTKYDLKFHSDWNWLIEVVEKIEGLEIEKLSFNFKIEKDRVSFFYTHTSEPKKQIEMFFEWGQKTKIYNTYKIVVEFIKWYNEQNK